MPWDARRQQSGCKPRDFSLRNLSLVSSFLVSQLGTRLQHSAWNTHIQFNLPVTVPKSMTDSVHCLGLENFVSPGAPKSQIFVSQFDLNNEGISFKQLALSLPRVQTISLIVKSLSSLHP
ncbi:hypothetical protein FRC03_002797 [Tulasnella sp. 419]|nr:hypothetical protein FRC03_002797 [Tulasnella sp. 419]